MIQCSQCEFFVRGPGGQFRLTCDPFSTVKEPECLAKWQLIKIDMMVQAYQATVEMYRRLAPMQEKMFRHMEREMEDMDDADRWKIDGEEEDQQQNDKPPEEW
jgi:hypothetical protein